MGSPPSPDTALKVSPFTPSHHLKDRLLSFSDFLLSNIEEWNNPHPLWPSPPPPFSFSGSDRFIKGRLPHRTAAISASLSSLFSDSAPLTDACKHGDGHDPMQVNSASHVEDVTHSDNDVDPAARICGDDGSTTIANTHSQTPEPSSNLNLLRLQVDGSAQGSRPNDPQDRPPNNTVNGSTVVRSEDYNECAHSQDADSPQILPSHGTLGALDGSSEIMLAADGHSVGALGVVAAVNSQPNALDHCFFAMEVIDKGLQDVAMEAPVNPPLTEQVDDLEEGELSERLSDDEQPTSMEEGDGEGEANIQKGSPDAIRLEAETQRGSPSDANSPEKRVLDSETDEEMNEPISSFVSRRRMQLLPKLANQKVSSLNSNSPLKPRDFKKMRIEEEQHALEKALSASFSSNGKPEQVKILQEGLSRVAIATGILDPIGNVRMDEAMGTPSKWSVQQGYAGVGQPEKHIGLSSLVVNEGLCLPTLEAGIDEKSASQVGVKKKTKRGPLTEERRKKRQRAKHKASERKLAKSGICKLKFTPYIDKTEERQKKPCSFYVKGICSKGASCLFSHDITPLTKTEVCKYFIMNCCLKGDDCPYSHTLSSFPCKYFHTRGRCIEGESCRFSHEPMSEEAKQEFLRKIEEEQRVRHDVSDGMGRVGSKVTTSSDKSNSNKAKAHVKGKEAVTDFMLMKPNDYSKLVAAKEAAFTSLSVPLNAANKNGKQSPFCGGSHDATEPSPDKGHLNSSQATGMENGGAAAMSSSGISATTQERRTKAEAFLRAQLDESRFLYASRHVAGLENVKQVAGSLSTQPMPLPMGNTTRIRVSSMSTSCKLDAKPLDPRDTSFQSGHQERVSEKKLVENGAPVADSLPTLLDLLLRPQERTLSKAPASNLTSQSTDTSMASIRSASNIFLDRFLK